MKLWKSPDYFASLRSSLRAFADRTAVDGLEFIFRADHWLEALFWSLLFIGAAYLTCRDCASAIGGYLNEATTMSVRVTHTAAFDLPHAILCMGYSAEPIDAAYVELLANPVASERLIGGFNPVEFLNRLKATNHSEELDEMETNILSTTLTLLTYWSLFENAKQKTLHTQFLNRPEGHFAVLDQLRQKFTYANISGQRLMGEVGSALCRFLSVRVGVVAVSATAHIDTLRHGPSVHPL